MNRSQHASMRLHAALAPALAARDVAQLSRIVDSARLAGFTYNDVQQIACKAANITAAEFEDLMFACDEADSSEDLP